MNDVADEEELRIRVEDGRVLACLGIGDPSGRAAFYFHGFPGSRLEGRLASGAARRLGLRLIAPDRPGFGQSTFLRNRRIGAWSTDVARIADALGVERFDVVGVSGGGPYALACAAGIPTRIRTVVLVGALGPLGDSAGLTKEMTGLNRLALTVAARRPELARLAIKAAAPWVRRRPERYLNTMVRGAPAADREVVLAPEYRKLFIDSMREALRQGGRGPAWELTLLARPWDFALADVPLPVQLWHGIEDHVVPMPIARHLAAGLPNAQAQYLPGEGHLSLIARRLEAILAEACG